MTKIFTEFMEPTKKDWHQYYIFSGGFHRLDFLEMPNGKRVLADVDFYNDKNYVVRVAGGKQVNAVYFMKEHVKTGGKSYYNRIFKLVD